jgi:hypothetical protein
MRFDRRAAISAPFTIRAWKSSGRKQRLREAEFELAVQAGGEVGLVFVVELRRNDD